MSINHPSLIALVTGASRGIGAEVAQRLALRGSNVIINFRSKGPRAEEVAAKVRAAGRHATLAQADLTDGAELQAMVTLIHDTYGQLDLLVLNASGGLEKEKPVDYAMQLNHTAQLRTVDVVLPLMPAGSTILFVTSHWAHFYGQQPIIAAYETVAASKKAGEDALLARVPEFTGRGVRLLIVSGDMIDGTITPRLLERAQPGVLAARRSQTSMLPTVADFAQAIVETALDPALPTGYVGFVGSTD